MPDKAKQFGPYELLEKVGSGGMGAVFKARRPDKEGVVALKIANQAVADNPVLSQRFHNEFKIACQMRHPNLVRMLGHGVESGLPFLVMEFVAGQSLDRRLKEKGPLPMAEALALFGQIAAVLEFIHQKQIVHRDVKPGNILMDGAGHAKLADLGLVKDLDSNSRLTNSGIGLGTFEYAAPEQFDDAKHVDFRCDIYGMAASLYVALAGKYPFGPGGQMRVLTHKLDHQFTPLSQLIEGVSPALDQIIIRALHPDPAVRPASIAEFLGGMWSTVAPQTFITPKPLPKIAAKVSKTMPRLGGAKARLSAREANPQPSSEDCERRRRTRHPIKLATTLGAIHASSSWPVQIMDISPGGLCLELPRRFEPQTLLNVFLPDGSGPAVAHLVRTCWIKALPDKKWLVGCLFVNPLEDEDVERFLTNDLETTNVLRKPKSAARVHR